MKRIKLIGKYSDNEYICLTDEYKKISLTLEQIHRYNLAGVELVNCTFINGKLRGVNLDLRKLPKVKKAKPYRLVGRIMQGKEVVGYNVVCDIEGSSKELNITKTNILALAQRDLVSNAKVVRERDNYILRGVGCALNQLPRMYGNL